MKTSPQILNSGQDPSSPQKCKVVVQSEPCIEIQFEDRSNDFKERLSLLEVRLCDNLELNNFETESNPCEPQSLAAEDEERLTPQDDELPKKQNQDHPHDVDTKTLLASNATIAKKKKVKVFMCDLCKVIFRERYQIINHVRSHSGEKPFFGKVCESKFAERNLQSIHNKRHFNNRSFQSVFENELVVRVKVSRPKILKKPKVSEKLFECELCRCKFVCEEHLSAHLDIHSLEKPLTCALCYLIFSKKSDLVTHLADHSTLYGYP